MAQRYVTVDDACSARTPLSAATTLQFNVRSLNSAAPSLRMTQRQDWNALGTDLQSI